MANPLRALGRTTREERVKVALLATWFFLTISTLWLLKPIRSASLLAHLGAAELPYVRFGSVAGVALVVAIYTRVVNRYSRLNVARGASLLFATVLFGFWVALEIGGEALGGQRWFVWALFILVDIYSTVVVAIFWTYTNDVVTREEADRLYGPIGVGGILGGIAGGAVIDGLVATIGPVHPLLLCTGIVVATGGLAWLSEARLRPPPRAVQRADEGALAAALGGGRAVLESRYLLLVVGIVVGYEFAAAIADFAIHVVFERSFATQLEIARMFGRVGWIVSLTALVTQLVIVPVLLPLKRIALLLPPLAMLAAVGGLMAVPIVGMAIVLAASDRGLNYSLQQVTKETLYVPLSDAEKYKAKAFIDMLVDRAAKALSSVGLVGLIAAVGTSVSASLSLAVGATALWTYCAAKLGPAYAAYVGRGPELAPPPPGATEVP